MGKYAYQVYWVDCMGEKHYSELIDDEAEADRQIIECSQGQCIMMPHVLLYLKFNHAVGAILFLLIVFFPTV
jgi:hypothetical protein